MSISQGEFAKHTASNEAWVTVEGIVYNVSTFAKFHPGGEQLLLKYAGKDATEVFKLYHHDGVLRKYGDKLKVGELQGFKKKQPKELPGSFGDMIPFGDPSWYQGLNSPYYKPTHIAFRNRVRKFVDTEIIARMDQWELDLKPPRDILLKMGNEGFLAVLTGLSKFPSEYLDASVPVPEDFDAFHEFILLDELSRCGHPGVIAALTNGPSIALSAIMAYGTEEQKALVAPDVLMGRKCIALAVSEPNAGSDVASLCTTGIEKGDKFIVNGNKKWITNASYADFLVTAVVTDTEVDVRFGVSLLLIDANTPGISMRKIGLGERAQIQGTSYIDFANVEVPKKNIIGTQNLGFVPILHNFNHERVYLSTICHRMTRVIVEECFKYANKRHTFGKRLADHDVIRMKLATMSCRVEQQQAWLESIVYQMSTMSKKEQNEKLGDMICGLKAQSATILEYVAAESTHIFGGNSLDANSVGKKIEPMVALVKGYVVPAGSTVIMELQMTKLALKKLDTYAKL